jgi:ribosomal protein L28
VSFLSDILASKVKVCISTSAIRSIEKSGGIDKYLMKACDCVLLPRFRQLKKLLKDKSA